MKNIYLFAAVIACLGAIFGLTLIDIGNLEITPPAITPLAHISLNDYSGMFLDPGLLPESPYELTLLASRVVPESDADIAAGKIAFANKDSVILARKVDSSNRTMVDLYTLNGNNIALTDSQSMEYTGRETHVYSITNIPGQYKFMVGGHYDYTSSVSYPLLAFFTPDAGGLSSPSYWSISPVSNSFVVDTDAGDVNNDGSTDYVLLLRQENASNDFIRLTVRRATSSSTLSVGQKYAIGNWPTVKVGKYTYASTKDIMVAASDNTQTDLLHYRLAANGSLVLLNNQMLGITTAAGKKVFVNGLGASDLDNDGNDELLVSGNYVIGFFNWVDVTQVYKYGTYGWEKKSEYVNATPGSSFALFAGTADVNSDGSKEIVSVSQGVYTVSGGESAVKIRVNIFKYSPGSGTLQRLSSHDIKAAAGAEGYWPSSAALGDYNADAAQELAINYWDIGADNYKLGIYSIGQDLNPPNITIFSPYYSTYTNAGLLPLRFYAYDAGGLNASSFRAKLTGPGGYDSGYRPYFLNYTNYIYGIMYNSTVNISGLPGGNYTVNYEVSDKSGNKKTATKSILISSLAAITSPNITVYSPTLTAFYNNTTLVIKFQAYDPEGINMSFLHARIWNSTFSTPDITGDVIWSPAGSKARNFTALYPLSAVPPSPNPYYLYMYAKDLLGYSTVKYVYLWVYATPSAPAPTPEPETPPAVDTPAPVPETPVEVETPGPEPEVTPAPAPETPADVGVPPVPETPAQPETPPTPPGGSVQPGQPAGGQPPQPGTVGGDTGAQSQADRAIAELEVKIAVAKNQGLDTSPMAARLDKAKGLAQEGKYVDAALEAQKGVNQVEDALSAMAPTQPPADYTIYLMAGAAIIVLLVIAAIGAGLLGLGGIGGLLLLLLGRKQPSPPAPAAPQPKPEPAEKEPEKEEKPAEKPAKKAKKGKN